MLWRQRHLHVGDGRPTLPGRGRGLKSYDDLVKQATRAGRLPLAAAHSAADARCRPVGRVPPSAPAAGSPCRTTSATLTPTRCCGWPSGIAGADPPVVGDAMAEPAAGPIGTGDYDLSGRWASPGVPMLSLDGPRSAADGGAAERVHHGRRGRPGPARNDHHRRRAPTKAPHSPPLDDTTVVSADFSRVLQPGEGEELAGAPSSCRSDLPRRRREDRPHVPHHRRCALVDPRGQARLLADGQIELLGRDSVTINSGGEKIFAETDGGRWPAIRRSTTWSWSRPSEPGAMKWWLPVSSSPRADPPPTRSSPRPARRIADQIPKAFIRTDKALRSPAGGRLPMTQGAGRRKPWCAKAKAGPGVRRWG